VSGELCAHIGVPLATFLVCFVSALLPLVNAELYLVAVGALVPVALLPVLAVLAAAGQMAGKLLFFAAARGAGRLSSDAGRQRLERWRTRLARWRGAEPALVFVSASLGLPPLAVVSVVAGLIGMRARVFLLMGFAGRVLRFGVVLAVPVLVAWWVS
jgi:membrane protein YqaA with SNARE-associated domain